MGKQCRYERMELRDEYTNKWHTEICDSMTEDLPFCCFAMWCGPCASYVLRKRALYGDLSRYTCCGGAMPCSGKCCEGSCPECCLCTETICCFSTSVAATRFMLQDEFNIRNTKCDNCIIGFMCCVETLSCVFSLIACILGSDEISELATLLNLLADLVFCTVCPCMQTQHKLELDKRDQMQTLPMMAPPMQQMSRIDQPYPPTVGYPPQQPPYGYGPPPPGYPAYGPPPPGYPAYGPPDHLPPPMFDSSNHSSYGAHQGYGPPHQGYVPPPPYPPPDSPKKGRH